MEKLLLNYQMRETGQILKGHTKVVSFYLYGYVQSPYIYQISISIRNFGLKQNQNRSLHKIP